MAQRSTSIRDRHRNTIRRSRPACAICGGPIDYTAPHLDPEEFVVDHVIPLHRGGADTLDNKQPAHRRCNSAKAARLVAPIIRRSGALA
jgi:5-methylcytosine-specific restriction endonuclease McrA